ncbi:hypothetical protein HGRIS_014946 [Hohenbuehelia grisea]|uniref:Transmembrane protein n=1 Tax=Hohenbuehelia grisea TaxID=104357 RepID=A0ABR3J0E2_9AGAR
MPSFKTLSLIAISAFAAFTGASPTPAPAADLIARGGYKPVPQTLQECHTALQPTCASLVASINVKDDVKLDVQIKPVIVQIKAILEAAIADVKAVKATVGITVGAALTFGGKVYAAIDLAKIICDILVTVFGALALVLRTVGILKAHIVAPLLCEVAELIAVLLTELFGFVTDLSVCLIPLVLALPQVVVTIVFLNVKSLIGCLNISVVAGLGLKVFL